MYCFPVWGVPGADFPLTRTRGAGVNGTGVGGASLRFGVCGAEAVGVVEAAAMGVYGAAAGVVGTGVCGADNMGVTGTGVFGTAAIGVTGTGISVSAAGVLGTDVCGANKMGVTGAGRTTLGDGGANGGVRGCALVFAACGSSAPAMLGGQSSQPDASSSYIIRISLILLKLGNFNRSHINCFINS